MTKDNTSPMHIDPSTAQQMKLLLVDPRAIFLIVVCHAANEPNITGFLNTESYVLSMWASVNRIVYPILSKLDSMPTLRIQSFSDCFDAESLRKSTSEMVSGIFKRLVEEKKPVRVYIQDHDVKIPAGMTGPSHILLITFCGQASGQQSMIIPSDEELLPEFDATGRRIVEFRNGKENPNKSFK